MGDLDDLAVAAQKHDSGPVVAATSSRSADRSPRSRSKLILIVIAIACAVMIAIIGIGVLSRGTPTTIGNPSDDKPVDPGFSVVRGDGTPSGTFASVAWWSIVNELPSPLVISQVRLNDEYTCPVCYLYPNHVAAPDTDKKYPVTLTIGESGYFSEFVHDVSASSGYTKEVVFVDISTNRGKFRYRPFRGFEKTE